MLTVKEVSLTRETLEEIREIDLEFYPNIGSIDWYLSRYKPWHFAFAAMDGGRMIGYFVAVPVRKELYDAILNGVLLDDLGVNPNMFVKESEYHYAVSIVIRKAYRGRDLSRQMLDMYFSKYSDKKTCVLAVSQNGYRLAGHYFSLVSDLSENVGVFASRA